MSKFEDSCIETCFLSQILRFSVLALKFPSCFHVNTIQCLGNGGFQASSSHSTSIPNFGILITMVQNIIIKAIHTINLELNFLVSFFHLTLPKSCSPSLYNLSSLSMPHQYKSLMASPISWYLSLVIFKFFVLELFCLLHICPNHLKCLFLSFLPSK